MGYGRFIDLCNSIHNNNKGGNKVNMNSIDKQIQYFQRESFLLPKCEACKGILNPKENTIMIQCGCGHVQDYKEKVE